MQLVIQETAIKLGPRQLSSSLVPLIHKTTVRHISGEWGHVFYVMRDCQLSGTRDERGDGQLTGGKGRRKSQIKSTVNFISKSLANFI